MGSCPDTDIDPDSGSHNFCCWVLIQANLHHHLHNFIGLLNNIEKNLYRILIYRRREDPGSHWAYGGRPPPLQNYIQKRIKAANVRLGQFSDL